MAYTKTNWTSGDPITQELMNKIEQGIADAHSGLSNAITPTSSTFTNLSDRVESVENDLNGVNGAPGIKTTVGSLVTAIDQLNGSNSPGNWAKQEILDAMHYSASSETSEFPSLDARISGIQTQTNTNVTNINSLTQIIESARLYTNNQGQVISSYSDMISRLNALNNQMALNTSYINTLQTDYENAKGNGYTSLNERLSEDESNFVNLLNEVSAARKDGTLANHFTDIDSTLFEARKSATYNNTYDSVDSRLETDEGYLLALQTEMNGAHESQAYQRTTFNNNAFTNIDARFENIENEIVNTHRSANDTLDARLDAIDDIGTNNSIINRVNTLTQQSNGLNSNLSNVTARVDTLETTTSNINSAIGADNTANTIKGRIAALESEIDTANQDSTLNNRFTAIEGRLTGIDNGTNTTISNITNAISNMDTAYKAADTALSGRVSTIEQDINNSTTGLKARIATVEEDINNNTTGLKAHMTAVEERATALESNVETIAQELSMLDNDTIVSTNTRIDTLESTVTNPTTGLAATKTIADQALATASTALQPADITELTGKVTSLEGKDTIIIGKASITYNNNGVPTNIGQTPSENADYLLQKNDDKYYYWRYINNNWELISGAGGGSSNAEDYNSYSEFQRAEKELNKDYYVLEDGVWHHYRYLETTAAAEPIEIGAIDSTYIKRYRLEGVSEDNKNYIDFYQFDYGVDTSALGDGTRIAHIELVGGGGGGTFNTKQLTRITPRMMKLPIKSEERIYLRFFYTNGTANESDYYKLSQENATMPSAVILGGGENTITSGDPANKSTTWPTKTITVIENGQSVQKTVPAEPGDPECPTGFYALDVTEYCKNLSGQQTFTLTVTDMEDNSIYTTLQWKITLIDLSIQSNFTENSISNLGENVNFTYIPSGDIEKTVSFYIDETKIGEQILSSRIVDEQTFVIPGYAQEGVHKLRVQLQASDNGNIMNSESIYRDLIWKDSTSDTLLLSSPYRDRTINIQKYNVIEIPYTMAGNSNSYTVQYYVNDFTTPYNEVKLNNTSSGKWIYRPLTQGTQNLRISVNNVSINFTLNVTENEVDIAPYSNNLILEFDPTGLSNNSQSAKEWTNGTYHLTVSDNFDWYNGGYGADETGEYFLIKSGTRAYFDYKMFVSEPEIIETQGSTSITVPSSKVYRTGQEMKIIFKTAAVRSIDTVWFTNMGRYDKNVEKEVGIELRAHEGYLKTDTASNEAIEIEGEQVAATNTYLYFPYSEEDRIELDININKENGTNGMFAMSYEDGVPSKAYAYTHTQKLYHDENNPNGESIITIGSDDCDVYIYKLRIYNNELTQAQVLRNFIADGKTIDECVERYQRNCIYYDVEHNEYSPYATSGFVLDPEALATKIPSVKVLMLDAPYFTENKKSFIKDSTLRCIHADGPEGIPFRSRGAADNWYFENGYHAGQGTTSDKYGDSGRNIDFLFNCDGSHKPSDKVNAIEGYKSQVTIGYGTEDAVTSVVNDWKGPENEGKISLTANSIPNNFFNFKVNIASSENVNNALLQKRYNDFLPYISPAKNRDARIKNDMEFVPAILFVRENNLELSTHKEFNDTNWHFYALGNLGDSKKTDYTRAYDPTDMNEFTIEISDNNTNNSQFQTGVYMVNGVPTLETFEAVQDIDDKGALIPNSYTAQGRSGAIATTDYVYPLDTPALKALWNATDPQTGELLNKNHWSLVNEPYDGDHSFEMRYACCGDYRDGKMVNDTTGQGEAQRTKNAKIWQAFYSWIVTASNEEFVRDLDQWCVRNAVEFWYAFTHYYTMMDSRAKNTFWHFAKTGKYRKVTNPIEDMYHVYMVSNDAQLVSGTTNEWTGTFTTPEGTFNASNIYYTEYAFDLWDYDNDTALGIDNNGELIFPYGKEDRDYKTADDPASGYVFNGAGSVFWRRLSDLCTSEISSIFNMVTEQFFSAENLIEQFDVFQSCYPEAIWQLDIQRKYIRPFTGDTSDGSKTRTSKLFLESMMQGRKKYQRRQWIRDQYYYFGSKYKLNNVTEDFFYLDCYTGPDDALITELKQQGRDEEAAQYVGSNWDLTITPYQDMYINTSFGETAKSPIRARAGEPVEMTCPFTSMNNTRIYIYGASRLKALAGKAIKNTSDEIIGAEGLASLYIGVHSIEKTDKLQQLYMGTDKPTYRNSNFTKLTLNENSPILETLDIRNCGSLTGELKLGGCNNLKTLEAEGTNITLATLPSSSKIETLHLPSTITSLSLLSAYNLTDFYMKNKVSGEYDYSNLRSLIINNSDESSTINWLTLAASILDNLNTLYLLNLKSSSINDISSLEPFSIRQRALTYNNMNISGNIDVLGSWSLVEKDSYSGLSTSIWPELYLNTLGTEQTKYKITYQYPMGDNNHMNSLVLYVNAGENIIDPYSSGQLDTMPYLNSTVSENYSFGEFIGSDYVNFSGWLYPNESQPMNNQPQRQASGNVTITAYFKSTPREYTIRWILDRNDPTSVVKTAKAYYGGGRELIAPTIKEMRDNNSLVKECTITNESFDNATVSYKIFNDWEKLPININPNINDTYYDIYGNWITREVSLSELFPEKRIDGDLTLEQLLVLSNLSSAGRTKWASNFTTGATFTCTTGHDGPDDGTLIYPTITGGGTTRVLRTDLSTFTPGNADTNIRPFTDATSSGFTLALDYCFNMSEIQKQIDNANKNFSVLASTYYSNISAGTIGGFALFYNLNNNLTTSGPRIGFGNMFNNANQSIPLGTANTAGLRNIVVLRYVPNNNENSSELRIYSGFSNGATLPTEVYYRSIPWSNIAPDTRLLFGHVANNDSANNYTSIINNSANGPGTIFWAKYWDYDIGESACREIASWPHEDMTFAVTKIKDNGLCLTAAEASAHGLVNQTTQYSSGITVTSQGWGLPITNGGQTAREICQKRVFTGLPTLLQSIIAKQQVVFQPVIYEDGQFGTECKYATTTEYSSDYVYLQSSINLAQITGEYSALSQEDSIPQSLPWASAGNIVVYGSYNASSGQWTEENLANYNENIRYFNFKFPYQSVPYNVRVFKASSLGSTSTIVDAINNNTQSLAQVRTGDIFIDTSAQTWRAYIYADINTILKYGIQFQPWAGIFATNNQGGWIPAVTYFTRSMVVTGTNTNTGLQFVAYSTGKATNSTGSAGASLVYSFAV